MDWKNEKVLVTGGGGFLGRKIIEDLAALNCASIRSVGRKSQPALERIGVEALCGDIRDSSFVSKACETRSLVIHTAALAGVWGDFEDFYRINVTGTQNIIDSCIKRNVSALVYTSSPSVAYSGNTENADESVPYPGKYLAYYPETKAIAERAVLKANSANFATVAIRPHLIWGPGDPHLLPRVIERAGKGKLIQVGDGKNLVDMTYVDNASSAHILAAETLRNSQKANGKAYFISDGKPVVLWSWINNLLKELGIPPVDRRISYRSAYAAGIFIEFLYKVLPFSGEPYMTRFIAGQLAFSHYFNISAARNDLGYNPKTNSDEALKKTVEWLKQK
ncbi:MAG TPA: 3-beta hydroxysteroid dehydrogenase [Lentisphaeria bacterium]|nr:MAG: 3-beta hydroxysteroid dehydrogenase [Lentisphaerae bacterium GWF2_50_93]HCE43850.1 3-beta hydroxysteroid dehydrogenase [Lentisphaeria bacterium]